MGSLDDDRDAWEELFGAVVADNAGNLARAPGKEGHGRAPQDKERENE
jgi:hypothetical protein